MYAPLSVRARENELCASRITSASLSSSSSSSYSSDDDAAAGSTARARSQSRKRTWRNTADRNSPTRARKLSRKQGVAFTVAVAAAVDASAALSARMTRAIAMWQHLDALDARAVATLIAAEPDLLFKLVDALLSTAYFPLQQLFFMTLAALLEALKRSHAASDAAVLQMFVRSAQQFDASVSKLLPLHASLDWRDPMVARDRVNALNAHTHVCRAFRVAKCWVSHTDATALRRVAIDGWVDFGTATLSFYETRARETSVINVPGACVERVQRDAQNSLVYIYTRRAFRSDGAALFVFETTHETFDAFAQALVDTLTPQCDYEHLKSLVPDAMHKHYDRNASTSNVPPSDDASHRSSRAVVSDDDSDDVGNSVDAINDDVSRDTALDAITSDLLRFLGSDIDARLARSSSSASNDTSATLRERFESTSASLTTAISAMSSACLSWSREVTALDRSIEQTSDTLQQTQYDTLQRHDHMSAQALVALRRDTARHHVVATRHAAAANLASSSDATSDRVGHTASASRKPQEQQQQLVVLAAVSVASAPWLLLGALLVSALLGSLHAASVV